MMMRKIIRAWGLAKIALSHLWLPKETLKISQVEINGIDLMLFSNEDVGRELVYGRSYEWRETLVLKRFLRPDDICIDVGANIGYYSTLMAKIAYRGEVHSFEPVPINWHILNINLILNKLSNAVPNLIALGSESGKINFSVSKDGAYSSILPTGREMEDETIEIKVETIDEYVNTSQLKRVDVIKVDAEGAEGLILSGAYQLFREQTKRPRLVMLELFDANLLPYGTNIDEIILKMEGWGYSVKIAGNNGDLLPFSVSMENRICNIFFVLNFK